MIGTAGIGQWPPCPIVDSSRRSLARLSLVAANPLKRSAPMNDSTAAQVVNELRNISHQLQSIAGLLQALVQQQSKKA